jgi:FkbM family methyltransferase
MQRPGQLLPAGAMFLVTKAASDIVKSSRERGRGKKKEMAKCLYGDGLRILDASFPWMGKRVLSFLFSLRPSFREYLLFGGSRACEFLQKAVQRSLGGPTMVRAEFTKGPLEGRAFECLSSEKYFMLGAHFEAEVQKIMREIVTPGDIVYDVGANVGYMTLLFATLSGPEGRVLAFEPSPVNFRRLRRNIELNRERNVDLQNCAVSDVEGTALFAEAGSMSRVIPREFTGKNGASEVRTIRLDDFIYRDGHNPPAVVKIDVEGHAGRCLAGMQRVLREAKPTLVYELHDPRETDEVSAALSGFSYRARGIDACEGFPRRVLAAADSRYCHRST